MSRRRKILLWTAVSSVTLAVILVLGGVLVLRSAWFFEKVRLRMVQEVEKATGGRVDLGSFHFDWHTMRAEVKDFVLHGTEGSQEPVLFHARSIQLGLRVISAFKKDVDLQDAVVDQPQFHIILYPDGTTNLPSPKLARKSDKTFVEHLLTLKIRHYTVRDGSFEVDLRKVPINFRGERLQMDLSYDLRQPRYLGKLSTKQLLVTTKPFLPITFDTSMSVILEANRITVPQAHFQMGQSTIDASGTVDDLRSPLAKFQVQSRLLLSEMGRPLKLPIEHRGTVNLAGGVSLGRGQDFTFEGKLDGSGLSFRNAGIRVNDVRMKSNLLFTPQRINLSRLEVLAFDGRFDGRADIEDFKRFHVAGDIRDFNVRRLSQVNGSKGLAWDGKATGAVEVQGRFEPAGIRGAKVTARVEITPSPGATPLQGILEAAYDQQSGLVQLGNSHLQTPATQMDFRGTLGQRLDVRVHSTNLNDILPAAAIVSEHPPESLPVTLKNGSATFEGVVTGKLDDPQVQGSVTAANFEVEGRLFDRMTAAVQVSRSGLQTDSFRVERRGMSLDGKGSLGFVDWKPVDASPVSASLTLQKGDLKEILAEAGSKVALQGTLNATAKIDGTLGSPRGAGKVDIASLIVDGEKFDHASFDLRYGGSALELIAGQVQAGAGRLHGKGVYSHAPSNWRSGDLKFDVSAKALRLEESNALRKFHDGFRGFATLQAAGTARVVDAKPELTMLDGQLSLTELAVAGKPAGSFQAKATSRGQQLSVEAGGDLRGSKVAANGEWQLAGDYPGSGRIQFSRISFSTLSDFAPGPPRKLPVEGFLEGNASFSGPALKPEKMQGRIELVSVEIAPNANQRFRSAAERNELILKNARPIVMVVDGQSIRVETAEFTGKDTKLEVAGVISHQEKTPWDLRIKGALNLAALRTFNADMLAAGTSVMDASVRGAWDRPQLSGTIQLKNASLYVTDVPNGIDHANGIIRFDNSYGTNRATVQELTAQTGGGKLSITGFVGIGADETSYRLQSKLEHVRVRYPEGVSTTLDASLSLNGTSTQSLLSGTVTVNRMGFNPQTDIGTLLLQSSKPVSTPSAPNEFLQGMQFDVRVETAPNVEFQASLTRDVQAEASLHLRGSPMRPVLLGRISVTQGEINFFGNKYTISQGEISFFNPVRLEPVLNMDLETTVRGVLVTIHFAGSLSKLNVSYRSDPPLASADIIALLAVGRAPDSVSSLASGQTVQNQSFLQASGNSLLGQAIAAPVSGRLQRFFGVSRLKIDPQLATLGNNPEARLTLEQQISKDITLTYITNLANAQQQIVRLEWDVNKQWSAVAVRDENGLFGIDFVYKKRFK